MLSNDKTLKSLGLAMRKGDVIIGAKRTIEAIKTQKNLTVFMAHDTAGNTAKKIKDKTHYYDIKLITTYDGETLSQAIGKTDVKVLAMKAGAIKL